MQLFPGRRIALSGPLSFKGRSLLERVTVRCQQPTLLKAGGLSVSFLKGDPAMQHNICFWKHNDKNALCLSIMTEHHRANENA